jgi:hypothetical protein
MIIYALLHIFWIITTLAHVNVRFLVVSAHFSVFEHGFRYTDFGSQNDEEFSSKDEGLFHAHSLE